MNFETRHIGITQTSENKMLETIGESSIETLCKNAMAQNIAYELPNSLPITEQEFEKHIQELGNQNTPTLNFIGEGFYPNYCPAVIRRNILENPSWYTQYTPYQAEISQGRLEALFNFQTLITELTGLPIANASLLDEGNATSEAIFMAYQSFNGKRKKVFLSKSINSHNRNVIKTRFKYLDLQIIEGKINDVALNEEYAAIVCKQFKSNGDFNHLSEVIAKAKSNQVITILNCDLLALCIYKSAAELGADICIGSGQRLGIPMGFGGPAAAFLACKDKFTRLMPGRIIGLSQDIHGNPAYRMALQTREQHIRREKATSNICTAQSLLAIINSFYAVYHGPDGLSNIAKTIKSKAEFVRNQLIKNNIKVDTQDIFDTISFENQNAKAWTEAALENNIEWHYSNGRINISFNETSSEKDIINLLKIFQINIDEVKLTEPSFSTSSQRTSKFLQQSVFNLYHSETKMLRYIKHLERKDLSLANAMIPLGSCTMKLNATVELLSLSNPNFSDIHPFSNHKFTKGYQAILNQLEKDLAIFTGFDATSLQPNSGAQGEFAGLMCIRDYFESKGESNRNVAFIPTSAHGTNPASASLCGLKIIPIKCLNTGEICMNDLNEKITKHKDNLAVFMITYPSTFGVFDEDIKSICEKIHLAGGQVYMDGANMNAQVGLTSPATIGADVCHLNLHKTFCIPHGGGGPGVGPICVKEHLKPFLPNTTNAISNTLYGSASICLISYAYIKLMGSNALKKATQIAILNANYIAERLKNHYEIMFTNQNNRVAHELIINCKEFKKSAKVTVEDIAKRLMDFGFHAPTMSWPVPDTLMIEPTESEGKDELDRFCDSLIKIKEEINTITSDNIDSNPLKNAPHTQFDLKKEWKYNYSMQQAFFPLNDYDSKFWPAVNRINNAFGDRNLICSCQTFEFETLSKDEVNA
ncbi:MAG: aminomethyl-transferring glycine dehydrogenase [Candidatus Margulisiibacteriota bacterium]